jgi:hypothetical protein
MNIFELIIFLLVTGSAGAGVGAIVGLFTGHAAPGAKLGALLGPVAGGVALTIWGLVVKLQEKRMKDADRTTAGRVR